MKPYVYFLLVFLFLPAAPALADLGLALHNHGWIFALHGVLNVFALQRVWRAKCDNNLVQLTWTVVSLTGLIVGPIMCLGLFNMPAVDVEYRESNNQGGGSLTSPFSGMSYGDGGAEGIPSIARAITGEPDPDEPPTHSHLAEEYLRAARTGDPQAQTHYGIVLEYGDDAKQDYRAAAEWYRKAADQGFPAGQARLADLHSTGKGVPKSEVEACFWFTLAAKGNPKYAGRRDEHFAKLSPAERELVASRVQAWRPQSAARVSVPA